MSRVSLCLVLVFFVAGNLSAPTDLFQFGTESRIVGGIVAPAGVHTWLVSLRSNNTFGSHVHFCGGSIITANWLVTAAHCLEVQTLNGNLVDSFRAWSGTNFLDSGGNQHIGIRAILHPDYIGLLTVKNDIALIEVQSISFHVLVSTISIDFHQFIGGGAPVTVAGWGADHGDSGSPLVLESNRKQVGIVSWGFPCAIGGPDVYVRVSAFAAWIRSWVAGV